MSCVLSCHGMLSCIHVMYCSFMHVDMCICCSGMYCARSCHVLCAHITETWVADMAQAFPYDGSSAVFETITQSLMWRFRMYHWTFGDLFVPCPAAPRQPPEHVPELATPTASAPAHPPGALAPRRSSSTNTPALPSGAPPRGPHPHPAQWLRDGRLWHSV